MVVCYSKLSEGRQGHVTKYLGMQSPIENCKNAEVGKMPGDFARPIYPT